MPKTTDKKLAYLKQYSKDKTVRVSINLNREHDADIIERLETIGEARQAYIKRLIREDAARV